MLLMHALPERWLQRCGATSLLGNGVSKGPTLPPVLSYIQARDGRAWHPHRQASRNRLSKRSLVHQDEATTLTSGTALPVAGGRET